MGVGFHTDAISFARRTDSAATFQGHLRVPFFMALHEPKAAAIVRSLAPAALRPLLHFVVSASIHPPGRPFIKTDCNFGRTPGVIAPCQTSSACNRRWTPSRGAWPLKAVALSHWRF